MRECLVACSTEPFEWTIPALNEVINYVKHQLSGNGAVSKVHALIRFVLGGENLSPESILVWIYQNRSP